VKNEVFRIIDVQPVEPSALDNSSTISHAVTGSTGWPPTLRGTNRRKTPAAPILSTRSFGTQRAASVSVARAVTSSDSARTSARVVIGATYA
jgi:hypothetical protein